jgi:hypothetical protein
LPYGNHVENVLYVEDTKVIAVTDVAGFYLYTLTPTYATYQTCLGAGSGYLGMSFFPGSLSEGLVATGSKFCGFSFNSTAITVNTAQCITFGNTAYSIAYNTPFTRIVLMGYSRLELH